MGSATIKKSMLSYPKRYRTHRIYTYIRNRNIIAHTSIATFLVLTFVQTTLRHRIYAYTKRLSTLYFFNFHCLLFFVMDVLHAFPGKVMHGYT